MTPLRRSTHASARARWAALASVWTVVVWLLLTWPPPPSAPDLGWWLPAWLEAIADKVVHASLFFVQALLLHRALRGAGGPPAGAWLLAAVLLAVLYGGVTELRQRTVPGRDADPWDLAANAAGALAYAALPWRASGAGERAGGARRGARNLPRRGGGGQ